MNKVNKVLRIIKKSSRRRRWREELRLEEEVESQELCDPSGLCRLHLCVGGAAGKWRWMEVSVTAHTLCPSPSNLNKFGQRTVLFMAPCGTPAPTFCHSFKERIAVTRGRLEGQQKPTADGGICSL
ncbi:hypothetical protein Y1Q_0023752 [Alligator mississippiensis]|uniref:Uncharacterized protein n=1 Tax=Alligator mississippiensis TaxID=8496 RepID=A0A151MK12_ALLMI|nr:hypothetical protein Y1Q_0023752 [Alligator mississippiensis]